MNYEMEIKEARNININAINTLNKKHRFDIITMCSINYISPIIVALVLKYVITNFAVAYIVGFSIISIISFIVIRRKFNKISEELVDHIPDPKIMDAIAVENAIKESGGR